LRGLEQAVRRVHGAPPNDHVVWLDEPLYERERRVGDLAPATVDHQRVAAVRHLDDLGHAVIAPLLVVDERLEEITGRSLRETETLVELWWALERRRLG
jgi:hypothetical protein